jgi:ribosome maturation factor RimP
LVKSLYLKRFKEGPNWAFFVSMTQMIAPELQQIIESSVGRKGAHLIDLEVRGDRGRPVIEVYIDTASGVTTELCAEVSRDISAAIDAGGLIPARYRLEVSSPGIERPLKFPWQYSKHVGRVMHVKVRSGTGELEMKGVLAASTAEGVSLQIKGQSEPVTVPFSSILEARVPAPW